MREAQKTGMQRRLCCGLFLCGCLPACMPRAAFDPVTTPWHQVLAEAGCQGDIVEEQGRDWAPPCRQLEASRVSGQDRQDIMRVAGRSGWSHRAAPPQMFRVPATYAELAAAGCLHRAAPEPCSVSSSSVCWLAHHLRCTSSTSREGEGWEERDPGTSRHRLAVRGESSRGGFSRSPWLPTWCAGARAVWGEALILAFRAGVTWPY